MGWPTNIKFLPEIYTQIFTGNVNDASSNRAKLQNWAITNLKDGNDFEYNLGDFVRFLRDYGNTLQPPFLVTADEAKEWLDILQDHFLDRPILHRAKVERVIRKFLKHRKSIVLEVRDEAWVEPDTMEPDGGRDGKIVIRSPRRPHVRRKARPPRQHKRPKARPRRQHKKRKTR